MKVMLLSGANTIHTQRWANGLVAAGVSTVCVSQHEFLANGWDDRIERVRLPRVPMLGYLTNGGNVARQFVERGCDLLNAHYATGYGLLALRSGVRPWVMSVWGSDVYDFPATSPLHRQLVRTTLRSADAVASTSHAMARQVEALMGHRPLRDQIAITPFGVDSRRFTAERPINVQSRRPLVIGTVKKLEPKYGIDTLIRGFAMLKQSNDREMPVLRLVGEGGQRPELQALVADLGLGARVQFVGAVAHSVVPDELRGFDVFAAVSRLDSESFGVSAIEASACGLPVVVSDAGGLPEVVRDGKTGLVVAREDPVALARALQRLLDDPALRERLGRAGRDHVQAHYEWDACVQRMIALYQRVAHQATVGRSAVESVQ